MVSASNPHIKLIRKLRSRKTREETGLFYIEGLRLVIEAIQSGIKMEYLVIAPGLLTSTFANHLINEQVIRSYPVHEVSDEIFKEFALKDRPQGLAAVAHQKWTSLDQILDDNQSWIALDAVQDPGNLGTILRTSDAVGDKGVILLDHATDPYDPTSVRASMGALFSQLVIRTDMNEFTQWKQAHNIPVIGTSGTAAQDYHIVDYPDPLILLMGSEKQGLQEIHMRLCDMIVKIPMVGRSDSLNLAVATAIILYEIFNQHRPTKKMK
jgi:RNA methyltransferase, TrmH family